MKSGALFAPGYQLTILNLFALRYIKHLKMTAEDGNQIIEKLLNTYTGTEIKEQKIKEVMPFDLDSKSCLKKFQQMLAPKKTNLIEYDYNQCIKLAIFNSEDEEKLLNDCLLVKERLENDKFSTLGVILDNKYSRTTMALRLVKKYCI